ncbi:hypothetical protein A2U01_0096237, partial [Trifolium medium]|nr:hypothetical protein [Trifolium medium]
EGVCFRLWVVEETRRQGSVVILGGGLDDQGSVLVPSEASGSVGDGGGVEAENSGEDGDSGNDMDVDKSK